jgi:hypothetical protein
LLSRVLGRSALDKTGLTENFDSQHKMNPDDNLASLVREIQSREPLLSEFAERAIHAAQIRSPRTGRGVRFPGSRRAVSDGQPHQAHPPPVILRGWVCPLVVDESTADKSEFAQSAQVDRSRFGLGSVMSCNEEHIVIDFDDHGEKAFAIQIVLTHLKMSDRQPPVRKNGARRAAAGTSLMPEGSLTPYANAYLDDKWRLVVEVPTVGFSEERRELFKRCYGPDWPVVRCEWQAGGRKGLRLSPVQPLDAQFCNSETFKDRKIINAIAGG